MAVFNPVTHCIFDMDGLLLDTETVYQEIISELVGEYGKEYTDDVRAKVMGTVVKDTIRILMEELKICADEDEVMTKYKAMTQSRLSDPPLLPGAERLIRHLHKCGVPICVATSSGNESVDLKLANHKQLFSLFSHIVMGSSDPEVKQGKPSPDIFLIAAKRFSDNPSPSKCLVFEDSFNGVKAALAAGMQVVMVPDPIVPEQCRQLATVAISSLEHFVPQSFSLPPF